MLKAVCVGDKPAEKTVLIPQAIVERASTRRIDARTTRARRSSR
jgi:hypothetical protein